MPHRAARQWQDLEVTTGPLARAMFRRRPIAK